MGIRSKAGLQKTATAWGNPAEKWLGYSTVKSSILGELVSDLDNALPTFARGSSVPAFAFGKDSRERAKFALSRSCPAKGSDRPFLLFEVPP